MCREIYMRWKHGNSLLPRFEMKIDGYSSRDDELAHHLFNVSRVLRLVFFLLSWLLQPFTPQVGVKLLMAHLAQRHPVSTLPRSLPFFYHSSSPFLPFIICSFLLLALWHTFYWPVGLLQYAMHVEGVFIAWNFEENPGNVVEMVWWGIFTGMWWNNWG